MIAPLTAPQTLSSVFHLPPTNPCEIRSAVGDNDQREMSLLTTCADKFFFKISALVGTPRVDQDIVIVGFDEITVDAAQFEGERQIDQVDFCWHVVVLSCRSCELLWKKLLPSDESA